MGMRLRLFIMMALQIGIWGAWAPKQFPYMSMLGFTPGQQALAGSAWGIAAIVGIFFSNQFADRNFAAQRFLSVSHLLGGLCLVGTAMATSFTVHFACFLLYSLLYVPTLSVTNTLAFSHLSDPSRDFGTVRMGGTLGWVVVSWPFIFLLDAHAGPEQVRWIFLVGAALSFVLAGYALTLPDTPPRVDQGSDPLAWRRALRLLKTPFVAVLFAVTFIDSVVHNGYFVLSDAFLTNRVGIAGNLSMVVLSLGQVAEMLTMLILGRVLAKLGWRMTMMIGIAGHAARFLIFAFMADTMPAIIAVQLLHGICYAFFFATVYIFVDENFPKDVRTSAQGLFNLLILGVGMVVASFLFPALAAAMSVQDAAGHLVVNYRQLFLVPAGLALAGVVLLATAFRPPGFGPTGAHSVQGH